MISELRGVACHMGYATTSDTNEHTPPLPQPVLDLPTSDGWKAKLTWLGIFKLFCWLTSKIQHARDKQRQR